MPNASAVPPAGCRGCSSGTENTKVTRLCQKPSGLVKKGLRDERRD